MVTRSSGGWGRLSITQALVLMSVLAACSSTSATNTRRDGPALDEPQVVELDEAAEAVIAAHAKELEVCFAAARKLEPTGTVVVQWTVESSGAVSETAVISALPSDTAFTTCVSAVIEEATFPRPDGLGVSFQHAFPVATQASLTKAMIKRIVSEHREEVAACYREALRRDSSLEGSFVLQWVIASNGTVVSVGLVEAKLRDEPLQNCVMDAIRQWAFPPREGNRDLKVTYPFVFDHGVREVKPVYE